MDVFEAGSLLYCVKQCSYNFHTVKVSTWSCLKDMENTMDKNILYGLIKSNASNMSEGMEITDDIRLIEDLGYDSVDLMQLIVDIEEEFGVDFMNNDILAEKIATPGSLMELILYSRRKDSDGDENS